MPEDNALRFAERLLALLDAAHYTATYKLATLLALIDVAAERTQPDRSVPDTLSAKEVGHRVIELYCAGRLASQWDIDHFLPWSRHPDNSLGNLVAAHAACNNAKSASLAGLEHLRHWLARFQSGDPACAAIAHTASATGWPRRSDRVLSTARATYLWLPDGTRLWQQGTAYEPLEAAKMRALLASVT